MWSNWGRGWSGRGRREVELLVEGGASGVDCAVETAAAGTVRHGTVQHEYRGSPLHRSISLSDLSTSASADAVTLCHLRLLWASLVLLLRLPLSSVARTADGGGAVMAAPGAAVLSLSLSLSLSLLPFSCPPFPPPLPPLSVSLLRAALAW